MQFKQLSGKFWPTLLCTGSLLTASTALPVHAAVTPYVGDIMMTAANFCPLGWAKADGRLLYVSEHMPLFAKIGTIYGGDGRVTFALPDLRGRVMVGVGEGPGLNARTLGERHGSETLVFTSQNLGGHTHTAATSSKFAASSFAGTSSTPANHNLADDSDDFIYRVYTAAEADVTMESAAATSSTVVQPSGGSNVEFAVTQPYLVITYCIAVEGVNY